MNTHLDFGCGDKPRNPFNAQNVFGIDIHTNLGNNIASANLSVESIPFPDNNFDSVSAYDFIEHIPRNIHNFDTGKTHFPFIFFNE